jgi:RHS repeat-associated protein
MRRFSTGLRVLAGGLLFVFAACSGSRSEESVGSTSQAVVTPSTARVLSFEQPTTDWRATNLNLQQGSQFVDGQHSAAINVVSSGGRITSIPLSSLGPISSTVTLQVRLPAYAASTTSQGQVALWLNSPTAGVWAQYFGPFQFSNTQTGVFRQAQFALSPATVAALSNSTYSDLTVSVELDFNPNPNSSAGFSDPFYIDKLDFGQPAQGGGGGGGASGGNAGGTNGGAGGASGTAGSTGGTAGVKGTAGAGGFAGAGGSAGATGTTGASGSAGTSGATGTSGAAGSSGISGAGGAAGSGTTGPCSFSAQASGSNADVAFTVKLPKGVRREDIGVGTTGGFLTLADGVSVVRDGSGFGSISSVQATSRTNLGVAVQVQDVYTEALGIDLRNNAHVHGTLETAADLGTQAGAAVDGSTLQNTSLQPLQSIDWTVSFPNANRGNCSLEPGNVEVIDPGSYGNLAVKSGSHLKIRSGTYYFNSLSFEPQAVLDIDNAAGPVFIYIRGTFAFSGTVAETNPAHLNFVFGVAGTATIAIQTAFRGVLVAPHATVSLATDSNVGHVGAFFANALIAQPNTAIHLRPLSPTEFCAATDACSSFCPCADPGCTTFGGCADPCTANPLSPQCLALHCSNGVRDGTETDVDCGGGCAPCTTGHDCSADADCASGLACGENNGACFGQARSKKVCWQAACANDPNATGCGAPDSPCGQNCACVNGCDPASATNTCAAGEVCKAGLAQIFDASTPGVCTDPRCPSNDPALCGTADSLCGARCVCTPSCSAATCQNPDDGCGGLCLNVCKNGEPGCQDDITCAPGFSCIAGTDGVNACRPGSCAFQVLAPPLCGTPGAPCGDTCPTCTASCEGRQCGPDPSCGKSCGTCGAGTVCDLSGQCVTPHVATRPTVPDGNGGQKPLPELPKPSTSLVGALKGEFSVSEQGSAEYSIPIEVPPGRAGLEPALTLQYSGSRANGDVGVGWHLEGLSKITRCPRSFALDGATGPVQNNRTDLFCIDGKRLESVSGVYGAGGTEYRTLIDSFAKVISYTEFGPGFQLNPLGLSGTAPRSEQGPDSFQVWTKDGRILTYGRTKDSLILANNGVRYAWLLNKVEDRAGNSMLVSYTNLPLSMPLTMTKGPTHVVRPSAIAYTGHGAFAGNREVRFSYEGRMDPQLSFTQGGSPFVVAQRLSRVTTFVDSVPVKNYQLKYAVGELSQVDAISECAGGDDSRCKAPTSFQYTHEQGFFYQDIGRDLRAGGQLDINGDGIPDFLSTNVLVDGVPAQPTLKAAQVVSDVVVGGACLALDSYVGPEAGFAVSIAWDIIKAPFWGLFAKEPTITFQHSLLIGTGKNGNAAFSGVDPVKGLRCEGNHPAFMLDYDQDGQDDVVQACGDNDSSLYVSRSTGDGTFAPYPDDKPVVSVSVGFASGRARTTERLAGPILIDVDGDGLQDVVSCKDQYTLEVRRRLTPPLAFAPPLPLSSPLPPPPAAVHQPPPPRELLPLCSQAKPTFNSADVDGDGTPDLLARGPDGWQALRFDLRNGTPVLWWQPIAMPDTGSSGGGKDLNLGDFNGDGLPDVFQVNDRQDIIWLNTGSGRFYSRPLERPRPPVLALGPYSYRHLAVLDYNADNRDDFLEHWETAQYDAGNGTVTEDRFNWALQPDSRVTFFTTQEAEGIRWPGEGGHRYPGDFTVSSDIDGDGNIDLFGHDGAVFFGSGSHNSLLIKVTDGVGKVVDVAYGGYQPDERCSGNTWPEKCLKRLNSVVSSHKESTVDAFGNVTRDREFSYTFVNARMNLTGEGWLGFDRKIVSVAGERTTGNAGTTTTVDYEPVARYDRNGKPTSSTAPPYLYPLAGLVRRTTVDQHIDSLSVQPLQSRLWERRTQTRNVWSVVMSASRRPFPFETFTETKKYERPAAEGVGPDPSPLPFENNGNQLSYCRTVLTPDAYGNIPSEYNECENVDFERKQTTRTFELDPDNWLIGNPKTISTVNKRGTSATQEWELTYTGGLLTTVTRAPSGTDTRHKTTYGRDAFGNVNQIIEEAGGEPARTTGITYDNDNIFPATFTDAMGYTTQVKFDPHWGAPTDVIDPNGIAMQSAYDDFGRRCTTSGPTGSTITTYSSIPNPNTITAVGAIAPRMLAITESQGVSGTRGGSTIVEYDAYGRVVRSTAEGFGGAQVIEEQVYDGFGSIVGKTLPHTPELMEIPSDRYSYDHLRRLTRIDHSDGSAKQYLYASRESASEGFYKWFVGKSISCGPNLTDLGACSTEAMLTIDEESKVNAVVMDHRGLILRSIDGDNIYGDSQGNFLHSSNYAYGAHYGLIEARDNRGNSSRSEYDDYGRLISQTDPDSGESNFTNNGFDELKTTLDPRGRLRTYQHDSLGRLESISDPAGLTQWVYDQGPNAIGRITESISPSTPESPTGQHVRYAYEPPTSSRNRGLLQKLTQVIDGSEYPISIEYDDLGRSDRIHYPARGTGQPIIAKYSYDASGVLFGVDEVGSGTAKPLWHLNEVFQGHLVQRETFGNGAATTYGYHADRRWLKNIQTTLGSGQIQAIEYTHYKNGLIDSLNTAGSDPREFLYDNLNRLSYEIKAAAGGDTADQYTYDDIGNLTGRGPTVTTYRQDKPHLIATVGDNGYRYDANGNVFSRNGPGVAGGTMQSFEYTPFDLPSVITTGIPNAPGNSITTFGYSADEARVARRDSNGTTHFIADLYQRKLDSVDTTLEERFRFYAGGRQLGEIVRKDGADQTLYFHTNHLGSPETISDNNGASFKQQFDPFGAPLAPPIPEITRVGFTGQDHDNDLGLIDMKGRIYDPLAARFTTADPVMQAPFWSQGLNRYSYAFNNPVNNTDPSGFTVDDEQAGLGGGIMGWGAFTVGAAALSSSSFGAIAGGTGIGGLNIGTSLLTNQYSLFDGSSASVSHGAAPTAAPKGTGVNRGAGGGALREASGGIGAAKRPPAVCDVGMCLAQAVPAGEGAPAYVELNDGTGGGVPLHRTTWLDKVLASVNTEIALAVNVIVFVEELRQDLLKMVPPPKTLAGFPGTRPVRPKTAVQGGGPLRRRWVDEAGGIYEWDSRHGAVERYDKRGKHLGEFDAETGEQTKPPVKGRTVDP